MPHIAPLNMTLLLIFISLPADATRIFTWVDDRGVTHFSETPPPGDIQDTRFITLDNTLPLEADVADDDFYSVLNQATRMEARRLENEKLAAEKQQANAEARKARAEAAAIQQGSYNKGPDNDTRYYPVYSYYPRYGHHPWKPGHGHKPKPVQPVHPGRPRPSNPRTSLGKTPGMPR